MIKKIDDTENALKAKLETLDVKALVKIVLNVLRLNPRLKKQIDSMAYGYYSDDLDDQHNADAPARFGNINDTEWTFEFSRANDELFEYLFQLEDMDLSDAKLQKELEGIINKMPEVFDASCELATLYMYENKQKEARAVYEKALQVARTYIPKKFTPGKHTIPWLSMENRPFLRLLHGYAFLIEQTEGVAQAAQLYEELLSFNPNDNQGIRASLATAYLTLGKPAKLIELASQYPGDSTPEIATGKILALYQLGQHKQAKKEIQECAKYQKNVFAEILRTVHSKPKSVRDDGLVSCGGEDQAWYYWQSQGDCWMNTPGAREFLTECLERDKEIGDQG
jgi:tetratricopeptide (TPR) repeat protein